MYIFSALITFSASKQLKPIPPIPINKILSFFFFFNSLKTIPDPVGIAQP